MGLSSVVTPLLLVAGGGLLLLLARFGVFADALRRGGAWLGDVGAWALAAGLAVATGLLG